MMVFIDHVIDVITCPPVAWSICRGNFAEISINFLSVFLVVFAVTFMLLEHMGRYNVIWK